MTREKMTGYCYSCYTDKEWHRMNRIGVAITAVFVLLGVGLAIWQREPRVLFIEPFLLTVLFGWFYMRRFGFDRFAAFEGSGTGIKTSSVSPRMRRSFSWNEVSVIQITTMEGTRMIRPWDCFVIVKGAENALIKCQALETYGYVFKNPNRIAIPKNEQTEPFITAIAAQYGIPIERSLLT